MAGIKGQKSGGFGGKKKEIKRDAFINFRCTREEKKIINDAKGEKSTVDYILEIVEKNKLSCDWHFWKIIVEYNYHIPQYRRGLELKS